MSKKKTTATKTNETAAPTEVPAIPPEEAEFPPEQAKEQNERIEGDLGEVIEAILFAAGHPVPYTVMARVLDLPLGKTKQLIYEYSLRYNATELPRGVLMLTFDDSCQLCTKQQYLPYIRDALGIRHNGNLSNSSIETLAIIAYNQPVTRSYVDTVRGVDSSYAIGSLLERSLVEAKGRLDAPGRPMLYGTTPDFLRCFGLGSIADLPGVSSDEAAEMLAKINQQMEGIARPDENQLTIDDSAFPTPVDGDTATEADDEEAPRPQEKAVAIAAIGSEEEDAVRAEDDE